MVENPGGLGYTTSYGYNTLDQLTGVTQGSQTRTFVYDTAGRLWNATNPESGQTSYTYDANGNLLSRQDARGITVAWDAYDGLNRPTRKSSGGTTLARWCYDGKTYSGGSCTGTVADAEKGYLTGVGNADSSSAYLHTSLGRVTASTQTVNNQQYSFSYQHHPVGLTSITYPSGRQVSYGYDAAGRVDVVGGTMSAQSLQYTSAVNKIQYTPHGGVSSMTLGNGVVETTGYNNRLQPNSMEAVKTEPGSLWKLENFYCPNEASSCESNNGNVISQRLTAPKTAGGTPVLTQAYGYDSLNRLSSASESGSGTAWSQGYTLDRYGNLTPTGDQPAPSLACGSYSSSTNRCNSAGFGYSTSGNMTAFPGSRTATYDAEGRQATLVDSGTTYTYTYDGDGRRVKKEGGGTTVKYVYDALGRLAAEYSTAAAARKSLLTLPPDWRTGRGSARGEAEAGWMD